jgi:hypothetical protein
MGTPTKILCNGQSFDSITTLSEHLAISKQKVTRRLSSGWTPEQAVGLVAPNKRLGSTGKPLEFDGVRYSSLVEASTALGLNPGTIAARVLKGYSVEDALRGSLKERVGTRAKTIEYRGEVFQSHEELAAHYSQQWRTVGKRTGRGWTLEQALGIDPAPPRFRDFEGHARDHKWKEVRTSDGKMEPTPDEQGYKLYFVTNTVNDKVYVGLTIGSLASRLKQHFAASRKGRKSAFMNAIRKHGEAVFSIELLSSDAITYDELQEQEVLEITKRDAIRNGYNTAQGGSIGSSKSITIDGKTYQGYTVAAEAFGIDPTVFSMRVSRLKWAPEEAAGLVPRFWQGKSKPITVEGRDFKSFRQAALHYGQEVPTALSRFRKKGWTIEQALGIEPAPKRTYPSSKSLSILGVEYGSMAAAAGALGVSVDALRRHIRLGKTPDEAYEWMER